MAKSDKCCGKCCWFFGEDGYGVGNCAIGFADLHNRFMVCNKDGVYVSRTKMRHYLAVLLQANRYRRDHNVPAIYKMPKATELGKAIDFAYKYIKTFSEL